MLHWRPPNHCELTYEIEQTRLRRRVSRIEDRLAYLRRGQSDLHRETVASLKSELDVLHQKISSGRTAG